MYIDGFEGKADIIKQFEAPENALDGAILLYAKYRSGCYEGSAYILYMLEDKMYEVNGSHCSCYGLEGQWSPEEVTQADLEFRWFNKEKGEMPYVCENEEDEMELRRLVLDTVFEEVVLN